MANPVNGPLPVGTVTFLLTDVEGVGHVAFTKDDVVRHELVARIVEAYDNAKHGPGQCR